MEYNFTRIPVEIKSIEITIPSLLEQQKYLQLKLVAAEAKLEADKYIIEWMKNQFNPCGPHYLKEWSEEMQAQFIRNGFTKVGYYLDEKNFEYVSELINGSE